MLWGNSVWKSKITPSVPKPNSNVAVTGTPEIKPNYVNEKLKFGLDIPDAFKVEDNGEFSITISPDKKLEGQGPVNFIYVSVVPKDEPANEGEIYNYNPSQFKKLQDLEIGKSVSLADAGQPKLKEWFTYTRSEDVMIDGRPAKKLQNKKPWEFPTGTAEARYFFETNGVIYILGYYTSASEGSDLNDEAAYKIVSSFQLQ